MKSWVWDSELCAKARGQELCGTLSSPLCPRVPPALIPCEEWLYVMRMGTEALTDENSE